ncbi:FAD-dependent oxidoreductase [Streptosporangium sp. NPDC002544]|uniref:NAD(P)/FAD-dependent oxidoreductase n=1 Tax=Streptosporangium sp. NPDC002544 TaxID=3154538 RepID=UPI003319A915
MSDGTLVVGAGQAGLNVALTLRRSGYHDPITLVGEEPWLPYQRPPLSKGFLLGEVAEDKLALARPEVFRDGDVELVTGDAVVTVTRPEDRSAGIAKTRSGRTIRYSRLVLTVGGTPTRLPIEGSDLDGVFYLRTIDDSRAIRAALADGPRRVVVVGGGFVGLEVAASARRLGHCVSVVEADQRLLARSVAPMVSEALLAAHRRRGTDVYLTAPAGRFAGQGGVVTTVQLADGRCLPADVVIVGVGLTPRLELAHQLGLACDRGILVDESGRTSRPFVWAAGDCAQFPDPLTGAGSVRLESVQNAIDQGRAVGADVADKGGVYSAVPWFWSDQDTLKLQIAGLADDFDEHLLFGNLDEERFSVVYFRRQDLVAIHAVNRPKDYLAVRRALAQRMPVSRQAFANPEVALTEVIDRAMAEHR